MKHFIPLWTTAFRKQLPLQIYYSLQMFQNLVTITVSQLGLLVNNWLWIGLEKTEKQLIVQVLPSDRKYSG